MLQDLLRSRSAAFGMALIALVLMVALIGPALAPHDPLKPAPLDRLRGPSETHFFGTDSLGRTSSAG
jgi:peptide/nickel transport system permease protein